MAHAPYGGRLRRCWENVADHRQPRGRATRIRCHQHLLHLRRQRDRRIRLASRSMGSRRQNRRYQARDNRPAMVQKSTTQIRVAVNGVYDKRIPIIAVLADATLGISCGLGANRSSQNSSAGENCHQTTRSRDGRRLSNTRPFNDRPDVCRKINSTFGLRLGGRCHDRSTALRSNDGMHEIWAILLIVRCPPTG